MKRANAGFTIIEVVLVLAIAGLIFLVVFLALPNLQRSQRDAQRKSDVTRMIALLDTYHGNLGHLPWTNSQVDHFNDYYVIEDEWKDPREGPYDVAGVYEDTANGHQLYPEVGEIFWKARHLCNPNAGGPGTDQIYHTGAGFKSIVVWTQLETGGIFCLDNDND